LGTGVHCVLPPPKPPVLLDLAMLPHGDVTFADACHNKRASFIYAFPHRSPNPHSQHPSHPVVGHQLTFAPQSAPSVLLSTHLTCLLDSAATIPRHVQFARRIVIAIQMRTTYSYSATVNFRSLPSQLASDASAGC
jgi:hypothetical protein